MEEQCVSSRWTEFKDDDILQQQRAILDQQVLKKPFIDDKEPISKLAEEYDEGNVLLKRKIEVLSESYGAIRRTRGDGNCFFRAFMFSYLEHILETKDEAEVDHVKANIERCKQTLLELGYTEFTFEDFFSIFVDQLESVVPKTESCISLEELVKRSRDPEISDYVVMFFRFVTTGEIRKRSEFFQPFILGNMTVDQFCKSSVEPMGEESDHVHITALSDALGVAIRVIYLDRSEWDSSRNEVIHHDFVPSNCLSAEQGTEVVEPYVFLLYRPGHYDILYRKEDQSSLSENHKDLITTK